MPGATEHLRTIVRVFPDYAGSVVWFVGGPVDYAVLSLSAELESAMIQWESDWYAALDDDFAWRSAESAAELAHRGDAIARRLSAELGDSYGVEFTLADGLTTTVLRGERPGTNRAAIEALDAIVDEDIREESRIRAMRESAGDSGLSWTATAGRSTYDPRRADGT